ncbi:TPA: hypothetical protein ACIPUI_002033 [Citrobacter freundii]
MDYRNEIISYLQANKILALKLDHALTAVGEMVTEQLKLAGAGATRALYYASCFTDEYQNVCQKQKTEDIRFRNAVIRLIQHKDVILEMFNIYFEEIFRYRTVEQIEYIKRVLMEVNIHIASSSLTNVGFAFAVATAVAAGLNINLEVSSLVGRAAGAAFWVTGFYGVVQKAADSAHRLHIMYPAYYSALYANELEMMYFLIEPLFERAGVHELQWDSERDIATMITRMIR